MNPGGPPFIPGKTRKEPFSGSRRVCEHEKEPRTRDRPRNESEAPPVGTVGKQSPYNPGEM
ncbi:hypothetical protein GCM10010103_10160 [Streptomyces paradoxus]